MKLSSMTSTALAALLLAGTATAASALDFNFSFSDDCSGPGGCSLGMFAIPGTVTGEITGLTDNAMSAATHVWIDSIVNPMGVSLGLTTPFDTIANFIDNSFTVSGGQITDALYSAYDSSDDGYIFELNDPANSLQSGPLITGNSGGFAGVTYTPVPETSTWAMLLVGFAGLGFAGYRAKAKTSLSAA